MLIAQPTTIAQATEATKAVLQRTALQPQLRPLRLKAQQVKACLHNAQVAHNEGNARRRAAKVLAATAKATAMVEVAGDLQAGGIRIPASVVLAAGEAVHNIDVQ